MNDPGWYSPRPPSPIEDQFTRAAKDLATAIEAERWFGDPEQHHRYRVDFLLKDARLIVELDGHEYHSTPAQLAKDAQRQRYLTRAGYSVVRFTGREIHGNVKSCVDEVRALHTERVQRAQACHRIFYVDYKFVELQIAAAVRSLHQDGKVLPCFPSIEDVILQALSWLHERSFVTVFIFADPDEADDLARLNNTTREFPRGEVRFNVITEEFWLLEMTTHLSSFSHLYDDIYVMADDLGYVAPLLDALRPGRDKLIRRNSRNSAYRGTDLARLQWQDVYHVVCGTLGLPLHEM